MVVTPSQVYAPYTKAHVLAKIKSLGYRPVAFRPPKYQETWLQPNSMMLITCRNKDYTWQNGTVIILEKLP